MLARDEIARFFTETDVVIAGNALLRTPQIQGHQAAVEYFEHGGDRRGKK